MDSTSVGATPTVHEALQRHKAVLNENLELWKLIDANGGLDENTKRVVSQGYQDTLAMIITCEELVTTLSKPKKSKSSKQGSKRLSTDPDLDSAPNLKRRRVNGERGDAQDPAAANIEIAPIVDASGLFMIDPNPTNVNTLLGQTQVSAAPESQRNKKKKRRRSEQQDDDDHQSQPGVAEPKSRSKRRRSGSVSKCSEHAASNAEEPNSSKDNSGQNQDTHHEAFEAKVALRLKEKEDQRKKKVQKKRKRSSEASTVADEDAGDVDEPKKTRKPREKKAKSVDAAGIETSSKRRKRSRS